MPLRLVLGPANARKVGTLLDAHEAAARAGRTAWFVVPGSADVEPFQRELAGLETPPGQAARTPTPFGQVMVGRQLEQRLLARLGDGAQLLSSEHRHAVALAAVRAVIRAPGLTALAPAARSGWLAGELITLAEELAVTGDLAGGGAERALHAWAAKEGDRRGDELAALLRADSRLLALLAQDAVVRSVDRAGAAHRVAEALRRDPAGLDDLHLVLSGFDDLDPVQRSLVLTVARSQADVVVSLPFQAGREALAAASGLVDYLRAAGPVIDDLGEAGAGDAVGSQLAAVERRLFEQAVFAAAAVDDPFGSFTAGEEPGETLGPLVPEYAAREADAVSGPNGLAAVVPSADHRSAGGASPIDPSTAAVVELRGGGPDEEAALIAEHLASRIAAGGDPAGIVVAVASPERQGPPLLAALCRAGLPAHLAGGQSARMWPSVAAVLALLRAAADDGQARDLVDWLAGPGGPGGADSLDAAVRRRGAAAAREALRVWGGQGNQELTEIRALWEAQRSAAEPGAIEIATAAALRDRLSGVLGAPGGLSPAAERDVRAAAQVLEVVDGLAALARRVPELALGLADLRELLETARAPSEPEPQRSIAIVGPLGVRTRYPEVVVIARTQRGAYPAEETPRRVLSRTDRVALTGHGWPLPSRADHALSERYLAYEVVARPTGQLVVAWHDGDGDGKPREPSPLLAEVRRAAGGAEAVALRRLPAGQAARHALTEERLARIDQARTAPRRREPSPEQSPLLAAAGRDHYSVGSLQTASRCPAQWFVDHHLRPEPLSPDAAPLTAGRLRHELLAEVVRTACGGGDGQPLGPEALGALRTALRDADARLAARGRERDETLTERLMRDRVVAEIDATLPALCGEEVLEHQPEEFELAFGTRPRAAPGGDAGPAAAGTLAAGDAADDLRPPVVVERAGERLVLSGRIDRLDLSARDEVVVVDYKGANVDQYRGLGWIENRELQAGIYALVAERLVGESSRAVASLYQPVPGPLGQRPRGAAARKLPGRGSLSHNDRMTPEEWDELLDALVGLAGDAQRLIDDGIVAPDPGRCSGDGCRYPWLCREVQPS